MDKRVLSVVLGLCAAGGVLADNGEIGYAQPISNITVDGDLSDWPRDVDFHPIQFDNSSKRVDGDKNFDATFSAGFDVDSNALFVAIKVEDDVHVAPTNDDYDWARQDVVIAYVDFSHTTNGSGAALFLAGGNQRDLLSGDSNWDPAIVETSWDDASVAVSRDDTTTVYEWRFDSHNTLSAGHVIGIDFLIADQDNVDANTSSALYSWGPGFGKSQAGGRTGDLVLLGADETLGTVKGTIAVADIDEEDRANMRVRLQSVTEPRRWVQVLANDDGEYTVDLPVDRYAVSSVDRLVWVGDTPHIVGDAETSVVKVRKNRTTKAPALSVTPKSLPVVLPERGALFGYTADDEEHIDEVVQALMAHFGVPGVSMALVKDGEMVLHRTYGVQNAYTGEPVEADTLFEAASITKTIFAFTVNRLAERGEIDLDRPLFEYLEFEDIAHDERYKKITARHVLSHQTGFPNWRYQNDDGRLDIKFYPGIQYGYSGEGFEYLGRVVSAIKGEPLEDIVRRETVAALGMGPNTFFADSPELHAQASRGHYAGMAGAHGFPGEIGVAHSMYTEASSFSGFMIGLLAEKGLTETSYAKMLEPQVAVPLEPEEAPQWPSRFGLGFHMMNSPFGLAYGHGGNNGNFTCQFELYPEHDMGFVVFTNAETGWMLVNALREYLIIGNAPSGEAIAAR
ncbi:MAG: serine hydrolase [Pseudomonadota bacterium]